MDVILTNVYKSYGGKTVLHKFSHRFPAGRISCILGPSGCGKTTLLRLICGLTEADSGEIRGNTGRFSAVFQEDRLLPWRTALENVTVIGAAETTAKELLTALGLAETEMGEYPAHLSGGQQRRVALARALAADSDLLLLDEPFNGLDEGTWQDVVRLIRRVAERRPVVLVTHIPEQVQALDAAVVRLGDVPQTGEWQSEDFL